jgi:hypothetical protein
MYAGILLGILGLWLLLRTVRPDSQNLTLVDRILGKKPS